MHLCLYGEVLGRRLPCFPVFVKFKLFLYVKLLYLYSLWNICFPPWVFLFSKECSFCFMLGTTNLLSKFSQPKIKYLVLCRACFGMGYVVFFVSITHVVSFSRFMMCSTATSFIKFDDIRSNIYDIKLFSTSHPVKISKVKYDNLRHFFQNCDSIESSSFWMFDLLRMPFFFFPATRDRADGQLQYGFGLQSESLREARFISLEALLCFDSIDSLLIYHDSYTPVLLH